MGFDRTATLVTIDGNPIALGFTFVGKFRPIRNGIAQDGASMFFNEFTVRDMGATPLSPSGFKSKADGLADNESASFVNWVPDNFVTTENVYAARQIAAFRKRIFGLGQTPDNFLYVMYRFKWEDQGGNDEWVTMHVRHNGGTANEALTFNKGGVKVTGTGSDGTGRLTDLFYDNQEVQFIVSDRQTWEAGGDWDDVLRGAGFVHSEIWVDVIGSSATQLINIVSGAPQAQRTLVVNTPYKDGIETAQEIMFDGVNYIVYGVQQINNRRDYQLSGVQDLR